MLPIARGVHHLILRVIFNRAAAMTQAGAPLILILISVCWTGGQSGTDVEQVPIGLESGALPNSSFTASSEWKAYQGPWRVRLNMGGLRDLSGGWVARIADTNQWIQVDLLATYRITGVATQGRSDFSQWVTSFKIACSTDNVIFDTVEDPVNTNADKIFPANSDRNTVVFNPLPVAILCRYVRLIPVTWYAWISLRMELYGEEQIEESTESSTTDATTKPTTRPTTTMSDTMTSKETTTSESTESSTTDATTSPTTRPTTTMSDKPTSKETTTSESTESSTTDVTTSPTTRPTTTMSDKPTSKETTTSETTTTFQSAQGPRKLPPKGLAFTKPPSSSDMTTLKTTEKDLETSAFLETSGPPQTRMSEEETTPQGKPLKGLLNTLVQMNEAESVYFGLGVPMIVYFICLLTALLLRNITMWVRELHRKKEKPRTERPKLMYELVRF